VKPAVMERWLSGNAEQLLGGDTGATR
jgi:hypothetical protein